MARTCRNTVCFFQHNPRRNEVQIVGRLSVSQGQKTRRLLEHEEIGDRTRKQFLRHLRSLAGNVFPDTVLRTLWLGRLPATVQAIVATQDQTQLDKLAHPKTYIAETSSQLSLVAPNHSTLDSLFQQLSLMTTRIAVVISTIDEMASCSCFRGRYRDGNRIRSRPSNKEGICWYYPRFRDDTKRCNQPCSYTQGNCQGWC